MYTCNTGVYRAEHQTSTISLSSKVSDVFVIYTVEDDAIGGPYNVRVYM